MCMALLSYSVKLPLEVCVQTRLSSEWPLYLAFTMLMEAEVRGQEVLTKI